MAVTYCRSGVSSRWKVRFMRQILIELFTLDIRRVDDATIFFLLLAYVRCEVGRRLADRVEALQIPLRLEFGRKHGGVGPLRKLIDGGGGRSSRRGQPQPD